MAWSNLRKLVAQWLPIPRIQHPWPNQRFAVKYPRWKPYAGKPHVRFCVQRRLACSVGDKPAGANQRPRSLDSREEPETEFLKPIDDPLFGRGASYRAVMKMNVNVASKVRSSEGRARNR